MLYLVFVDSVVGLYRYEEYLFGTEGTLENSVYRFSLLLAVLNADSVVDRVKLVDGRWWNPNLSVDGVCELCELCLVGSTVVLNWLIEMILSKVLAGVDSVEVLYCTVEEAFRNEAEVGNLASSVTCCSTLAMDEKSSFVVL